MDWNGRSETVTSDRLADLHVSVIPRSDWSPASGHWHPSESYGQELAVTNGRRGQANADLCRPASAYGIKRSFFPNRSR